MVSSSIAQNGLIDTYTVGFFSVTIGGPPHGSAIKFDIEDALCEINKLGFVVSNIRPTRYLNSKNDKALYTDIAQQTDDLLYFKLCEVNRGDLPEVEEAGNVGLLPLGEGQGLMRSTHCIAFSSGSYWSRI